MISLTLKRHEVLFITKTPLLILKTRQHFSQVINSVTKDNPIVEDHHIVEILEDNVDKVIVDIVDNLEVHNVAEIEDKTTEIPTQIKGHKINNNKTTTHVKSVACQDIVKTTAE
jgi:hypothetical protein